MLNLDAECKAKYLENIPWLLVTVINQSHNYLHKLSSSEQNE